MKIYDSVAVALTLGLLSHVQSFTLPSDLLVEILREKTKVEVFDGVHLPTDTNNLPTGERFRLLTSLSPTANKAFLSSNASLGKVLKEELLDSGEKKPLAKNPPVRSEHWRKIQAQIINTIIKPSQNDPDPVEGYLYFGNRNFKKILSMLCQTNPFFASALTLSEDKEYFELIAYSPAETEKKVDSRYLNVISTMPDQNHRLNCKFNKDMTLSEITKFDESGNAGIVPETEWDYYSTGILFNLAFYASGIHATIHVLHHLMCAGIRESTHDTSLKAWADPYDDNIAIKYIEVAAALYDSKIGGKPFLSSLPRVLTGQEGFGGTLELKPVMRELLCQWGSFKNSDDFVKKFLYKDLYVGTEDTEKVDEMIKNAGLLTEFNKHIELVQPFCDELTEKMKESDLKGFNMAEKKLKSFMSSCGEKDVSDIDTISSWVSLMSCTGIFHGSTLSYTRLVVVPEVAMWKDITTEAWSEDDVNLMAVGFQTVQGMTKGRHVFTSGGNEHWKWESSNKVDREVMAVLEKYDDKANGLKTKYTKEVEKRDDLREYGWILTDQCDDGYDGKQLTITTYF